MPGGETTKYWLSQTGLELLATHEWRVLAFQIHKHFGLKLAFQIWFFSCLQPATGQFCQWTLMWEFQLTFGFGRSPEANQVYDWEFNDRMRLGCNKTTSITNSIEKINVFNFSRSFFFFWFFAHFCVGKLFQRKVGCLSLVDFGIFVVKIIHTGAVASGPNR